MRNARENRARILIIRPSALGDVCRTVPVLVSLRRSFPHAEIDWLVQENFAPAIQAHPDLDQIIHFPRVKFSQSLITPKSFPETIRWIRPLITRRYDLVFDCQGLGRSGLMSLLTAAPMRVGLRNAREFAWFGYTITAPRPGIRLPKHTVDQMLALVERVGIDVVRDMRLYVDHESRKWWEQQSEELGCSNSPYAVIAPTTRWKSKRWPANRFAQLLEPLKQKRFSPVIVIGSPREQDQVRELVSHDSSLVNLVGKTSIGQTMAVISQAGIVIANDSAPLHMAVGFNRPHLGLFGPTDPNVVGPYRSEHSVITAPESSHEHYRDHSIGDSLMRRIKVDAVIHAIEKVLNAGGGKSTLKLANRDDEKMRAIV